MAPGPQREHSQVRQRWVPKDEPVVSDPDAEAEPGPGSESFIFKWSDERRVIMDYLKLDHTALHELDPFSSEDMYRLKMRQWPLVRSGQPVPRTAEERDKFCKSHPLTVMLEAPRSLNRCKIHIVHWQLWIGTKTSVSDWRFLQLNKITNVINTMDYEFNGKPCQGVTYNRKGISQLLVDIHDGQAEIADVVLVFHGIDRKPKVQQVPKSLWIFDYCFCHGKNWGATL